MYGIWFLDLQASQDGLHGGMMQFFALLPFYTSLKRKLCNLIDTLLQLIEMNFLKILFN